MPKSFKTIFIIFVLAVFNFYFWSGIFSLFSKKSSVCFLDVGQGDSELISLPYGVSFLIDTGPANKRVLLELENHLPFFKKRLETVFISHTDYDHWGSLPDVLKTYKIKSLFWNGVLPSRESSKQKFLNTLASLKQNHTLIKTLHYPNQISYAGYNFFILWPDKKSPFKSTNNNSLVILAQSPDGKKILFTGDIQKGAEKQISQKFGSFLKADILKAPHHGAKSSLEKDFFTFINPKKVASEVGKNNSYHHPSQETLNFFSFLKAQIYRTDQNHTFFFDF